MKKMAWLLILCMLVPLVGCHSDEAKVTGTPAAAKTTGRNELSLTATPAPAADSYETVTVAADEAVAVVYMGDNKAAVINTAGQYSIAPGKYSTISAFIDNKAFAISMPDSNYNYEYCVIDKNGNVLKELDASLFHHTYAVQPLIEYYSEGITAIAAGEQLYGFINTEGEVILPAEYEDIKPFSCGLAAVRKNASQPWRYIDTSGKTVITLSEFSVCESFSENLAFFSKPDPTTLGFMDKTGAMVFGDISDLSLDSKPRTGFFQYCGDFVGQVAPAEVEWWEYDADFGEQVQNIALGIIDPKGNIIYKDAETDYLKKLRTMDSNFSEGLLAVETSSTFEITSYGFIDEKGNRAIPLQTAWKPVGYSQPYETYYENLSKYIGFKEGMCAVMAFNSENEKIGFINVKGEKALEYQYAAVRQFSGGLAAVAVADTNGDHQWSYIDKTGKTIISGGKSLDGQIIPFTNAFTFEK